MALRHDGAAGRGRWVVAALLIAAAAAGAVGWAARPATVYTTQTVALGDVESTVTAIGVLQPRRYVDVGAQVSGLILRLPVQPGSVVKKGDLLVEIDPSVQQATVDAGRAALAGLRAQVADQQAQHRLAAQQLARQKQMAADGATRDEDLQTAEATLASTAAKVAHLQAQIAQTQATQRAEEARLGYTRIDAPMAGTVVSVVAREGQTLNATYQTPDILRIADLSTMTVWTEVSEADVRRVKAGMPVYFTTLGGVDSATPRRWTSRVRQVLPAPPVPEGQGSTKAGSTAAAGATKAVVYTVLFDVDNADGELMPQMTAQVGFLAAQAQRVVAVPLAALTPVAGAPGAYTARVLGADGRPETRAVRVGVRSRHLAEVQDGLREGDRLVIGETPTGGLPWIQW
ncbi:efflux RND transporter periplasmic adaptor subunit [Variovorax arabinosiphilus]|uniref:efflux RND transporter periplasmic adaptor subunit n=1 Tax=Variovorax arabinosiphilus TaxID=3053498 RepID=UPI002576AA93|nr:MULTISPECIES: efflux RND transporter periplasmic adaptor subunit [unclassified Variovorax]MDM0119779.1 efflux RND transporter periplasmic adaptor subunit [Variovorax sp. J2L1-78]MDM0128309.1 efflux RND transporter periplasmic adaptor subunit [Variovorax sp. J2L1-63]MDM0232009.1 efflux RND transporter periplasmic adaptor subunit [Variovorax sp. J2R1-6]